MKKFSQDLGVTLKQIDTVLSLTAEGATIPFIARYRKDMTGSLDEVAIKAIIDLDKSLTNLNDRKEAVLAKIQRTRQVDQGIGRSYLSCRKISRRRRTLPSLQGKNVGPRQPLPVKLDSFLLLA